MQFRSLLKKLRLDSYIDLPKVLLPELLIMHFDIVKHESQKDILNLYF